MRRVAVTGVDGPVKSAVLRALAAQTDVEALLCIGETRPVPHSERVSFEERDHGAPLADLFLERWVDSAVHIAWCPDGQTRGADVESVLEACHRAGVQRLVVGSSARVYGPSWDRPAPRLETSALEGARTGVPAVQKLVRVERALLEFGAEHPELELAVARPCLLVGDGLTGDLVTLLAQPLSPLPSPMAPIQVCHVRDYGRALLALLRSDASGAFNVAPPTVLGPDDVAGCARGKAVFLRSHALERALLAGQRWGLSTDHWTPGRLKYLSDPWLGDGQRLARELGFTFEHSPLAALKEARDGARSGKRAAVERSLLPRFIRRR